MITRPRLSFETYTDRALSDYLQGIHFALSANVGTFSSPSVSLAAIQTAIDDYNAAIAAWGFRPNHGSEIDHQSMVDNRVIVEQVVRSLSGYVVGIANGSRVTVLLAGMAPTEDTHTPIGVLPAVQNLHSPFSKHTVQGQYRLRWKGTKGAFFYNVYASSDSLPANKVLIAQSTKTLAVYSNPALADGTLQYFWVTAFGASGESSLSDVCRAYSKTV